VTWSAFIFLFFSASSSKLPGYIVPMFPALALLLGQHLAARNEPIGRHAIGIAVFGALVAIAAPIVMPQLAEERTPAAIHAAAMPWAVAAGLAYALGGAASALLARRGRKTAAILVLAFGGITFAQILNAGYQVYVPLRSEKAAAQMLRERLPEGAPVFSVGYYNQTLPFHLGQTVTLVRFHGEFELGIQQEPEKFVADFDEFGRRWNALPAAGGVTKPEVFEKLEKLGLPMQVLYRDARRVVFVRP
jgi:4-amino-4-deoxy-L-arabinose transferase-like glycosyltransferase